ncbi:TPA: hypothetical protein N0F65_003992 [Lagenidium giganteum]|uniref:RING-type domain-containing protein n=1 Tax=Lagenidium giganteum TaxID=4803 RepID=A0AAV2YWU0_9STRA|nr:TPA: hypothetical protein N0F65_003992 [Lagenidium giganteum]
MGLEMEALLHEALTPSMPPMLLTEPAFEKEPLSPCRRPAATQRAMRKSQSDKPLAHESDDCETTAKVALAASAGINRTMSTVWHSTAAADTDSLSENQRQEIIDRAEEILRDKLHVGIQRGGTCPVCLTDDIDTQLMPCAHCVHAKCIKRWIQLGSSCPVCRKEVTGIEEAFTLPASPSFPPADKDVHLDGAVSEIATSPEEQAFEWGWFEDFDEDQEDLDDSNNADFHSYLYSRSSDAACPLSTRSARRSPLINRDMSTTFAVCRTFAPLRPAYDTLYADSKHAWMRSLPSHRHIAANIQIRSFRIVEARDSKAQHAEYLIELHVDGRYVSRWRRFSELSRFAEKLGKHEFHQARAAWAQVDAESRWFNRLELSYLHQRCKMLEEFAHTLLLECATAHPLADLVEC